MPSGQHEAIILNSCMEQGVLEETYPGRLGQNSGKRP